MAATFDGPNMRIILGAPTSGLLAVDVAVDLYSDWKEWQKLSDNSKYYPAFRAIGGDPLTPGLDAAAYYFLRNDLGWRIIAGDYDQQVNYTGNLVGEDSTLPLIVPTPGYTVLHLGLQPVTQRVDEVLNQAQISQYGGVVYIDTIGGSAGTTYPSGTPFAPVNTIADAYAVADFYGFSHYHVRGSITLTRTSANEEWLGGGTSTSIALNGQDVSTALFKQMSISGAMSGSGTALFRDCLVDTVTGFSGIMENCALNGTVTLDAAYPGWMFNCYSAIPGASSPTINANNGSGINLSVRSYNGGLALDNFTVGDAVMTIGFNTGRFNVLASNTNIGELKLRGLGFLNNLSGLTAGTGIGDQINTEAFLNASFVQTELTGSGLSVGQDATLTLIAKILRNKLITDPTTGVMTLYDDDSITPLATAQLYESTDTSQTYQGTGSQRRERLA